MTNGVASSLMVGFDSDVATLFVGPGSGVGTYGQVGIATSAPKATLDVNGYIRLAKNAVAPLACDAAHDGAIALTSSTYRLCVCKGGTTTWVYTSDGATACTW